MRNNDYYLSVMRQMTRQFDRRRPMLRSRHRGTKGCVGSGVWRLQISKLTSQAVGYAVPRFMARMRQMNI
jgi:hypothetical protein